jgi:DNA-binding NtrC family response regulator
MAGIERVVILSPQDETLHLFIGFLKGFSLKPVHCITLDQFQSVLQGRPPFLVICKSKFPLGAFEDVLSMVKTKCPGTPVVVSGVLDWEEYLHALQFGAFDCTASGCQPHEAERIITQALWESMNALRDARTDARWSFARREPPLGNDRVSSLSSTRSLQDAS